MVLCFLSTLAFNTLAAESWVNLITGKSLKSWQAHGGDASFSVEKGVITGKNGPEHNTFLTTKKSYANFELEFDVFLPQPLNSGVQIRSAIKDEMNKQGQLISRVYGPQVEIEHSPGESGYLYGEQLDTGWLTPKTDLVSHQHFKNDDWNHYRVVANGPHIQTWINGHKVSDYKSESLYSQHNQGFIGFQVHRINKPAGTLEVKWKNIRIKELPATPQYWKSIFNGNNLAGWLPKVSGYPLGENPGNIFTVKDGAMHISHGAYQRFEGRYGHIFYQKPLSNYKLRLQYRFLPGQVDEAPSYAYRNSGIMIHGEDPHTIDVNAPFPLSIEVQMLGADEGKKRTTGNICTPGTQFIQNNKIIKRHCVNSTSKSYPGDQWVNLEIHVFGSKEVIHFVNGEEVLRYQQPQLDDGTLLDHGSISLQAESHDLEVRHIELLEL